jgi:murein tripeptide amidase MpaA
MDKYYGYENLLFDVKSAEYHILWKSPVKCINIGYSVLNRPIYAFIVGNGKPEVLIFGGMHAREHVGGALISYLMHNLDTKHSSFIFIPILNVDGVELSLKGLDSIAMSDRFNNAICPPYQNIYLEKTAFKGADFMSKSAYQNYIINDNTPIVERKKLLYFVNGSNDFTIWKANANAVDLNVNWDANFSKGALNINFPSSENYIGK